MGIASVFDFGASRKQPLEMLDKITVPAIFPLVFRNSLRVVFFVFFVISTVLQEENDEPWKGAASSGM